MTFKLNNIQKLIQRDFKKHTLNVLGNEIEITRESDRKKITLKCVINELTRKEVKKNYDIFINAFENLSSNYIELSFLPDEWRENFKALPIIKEQFIINNRLFSIIDIKNNNYTFFTVLFESIEA